MTARARGMKDKVNGRKPALYRFTLPDGREGEMKTFKIDREEGVVALVYPKDKRWYVSDVDPVEDIRQNLRDYTQVPATLIDKGRLNP